MNIVKLQDIKLIHRNPLQSYKLTIRNREIKEIKKLRKLSAIPFTIATKRIKYLGIYLPKETNGEGNGSPLQYSCLVNPMDGGA